VKTLYLASRVHTHGEPATAEWLLVDERHVERAGSGDPPAADRVVDLPGTTIVPGFVDAHVHLTGTGIREAGFDLGAARSKQGLLELIAAWRDERPSTPSAEGGPRLLGQGFDESKWAEPELPTVAELDEAAVAPLILIRADGHVSIANTAALKESGVLELAGVARDEAGLATGVVMEAANSALQQWYFDSLNRLEIEEAQLQGAALAASRGVTCVHEMSIPQKRGRRDFEVLVSQWDRLPTHVIGYYGEIDIPFALDMGIRRLGGDFFLDGSIGAGTAAMSAPYADREGTGVLYHSDDELAERFHNAHLAGMQVGVHAIGDAAIEQAISVWERVYRALDTRLRRHFRARRHRVEHFETPSMDQLERAAALGLAISVQPAFDAEWGAPGELYENRLGADRATPMNPFRAMLDRGLAVGAGSDSPVTRLDPMYSIWAMEHHHDERQRLSRAEAIRLCTIGAARLAHLDAKKGRLQPGMHADFAAYEADPFEAENILDLRPVLTVSQGREVFAS
jgi:predicted amidohydrolase YtcJ